MDYVRCFFYKEDDMSGFMFDSDKNGVVNPEELNPVSRKNYEACLRGEVGGKAVEDHGVAAKSDPGYIECLCGSGEPSYLFYDAYDICCGRCCDRCEEEKKSKYRPEIFEGPYDSDEPIEPDEY